MALAINPSLKWHEVKDLLKRACDKIDPQGGNYDVSGHSQKYGFGRLNARTAVELAQPQPRNEIIISRTFDAPVPDLQTVSFTLTVAETEPIEALTVSVDLKQTYIGDLIVKLEPPATIGGNQVVLHNRAGGSTKNLKKDLRRSHNAAARHVCRKELQRNLDFADSGRGDPRLRNSGVIWARTVLCPPRAFSPWRGIESSEEETTGSEKEAQQNLTLRSTREPERALR